MPRGGVREGSGRPPGSTSKLIKENQEIIKRAGVIPFLVDAFEKGHVNGEPVDLNKRIDIAQFLTNKFMPSQKAVELSGDGDDGEIRLVMVNYGDKK